LINLVVVDFGHLPGNHAAVDIKLIPAKAATFIAAK